MDNSSSSSNNDLESSNTPQRPRRTRLESPRAKRAAAVAAAVTAPKPIPKTKATRVSKTTTDYTDDLISSPPSVVAGMDTTTTTTTTATTTAIPVPPLQPAHQRSKKGAPKKEPGEKKTPRKEKAAAATAELEDNLREIVGHSELPFEFESQLDRELQKSQLKNRADLDLYEEQLHQQQYLSSQVFTQDLLQKYLHSHGYGGESTTPSTHNTPQLSSTQLFDTDSNNNNVNTTPLMSTPGVKKPRILKSEHPKAKSPKTSKKQEKLQRKYIRYHTPDLSIRGDWTVHDDQVLLENIQFAASFSEIAQSKEFTKPFTAQDIEKRWRTILFDMNGSDEASGMLALHPPMPKVYPMTKKEESLFTNIPINLTRANFMHLLLAHREFFHHSRTSSSLQSYFKDILLSQDISKFPNYLNFIKDQREKIDLINSLNISGNSIRRRGDNNDNDNKENKENVDSGNDTSVEDKMEIEPNDHTHISKEKEKEILNNEHLIQFLYQKEPTGFLPPYMGGLPHYNSHSIWDNILSTPLQSKSELEDDLILNPFSGIPHFMMIPKDEKRDLKSMIKVEKEYEIDRDKDFKSLAIIRGKNIRYLMKSKDIIVGRNFSDKNRIDLDLNEENPNHINRISKKQLVIKLKSDTNFYIQNIGKNSVFVNGCPLPQYEKIHLQDLSLIEFSDIKLIFEINKSFLAKIKRQLSKSSSSSSYVASSNLGGFGLLTPSTTTSTTTTTTTTSSTSTTMNNNNNNNNNDISTNSMMDHGEEDEDDGENV
ncbi:hypothetical protein CYY_010037 [Polysphondylium violaceum]|uniref:FHA domain-containing protein n=1 Tax=Polysphondylium violaceum TaxID=133409 RepID=A0A8J4UUI5_9MYCE|nr:hypothetical protein CYY_010037 [Polysphondylium violaceum]